MGGNVAEWVHDAYSIPSANGSAEIDPLGAQTGDNYVIRGASWSHSQDRGTTPVLPGLWASGAR